MNFSKRLLNIAIWKAFAEIHTKKRIILSGTPFQNNFKELRSIIRLLLLANDEAMDFFNTLIDNVTYRRVDEIRKNMDNFLRSQNGVIFLNPLKIKRIRYDSESCS